MHIQTSLSNLENQKKYTRIREAVHQYLQEHYYIQIDVPVLSPVLIPEPYLEVFETKYILNDKSEYLYLTPSPELFLKRLIEEGIGSCYALTKSFRNSEPATSRHSPEFTMLEFYKINTGYMEFADDVLGLFRYICRALYGGITLQFQGKTVSFDSWEKITVSEAFEKYAEIKNIFDQTEFFGEAEKKGFTVSGFSYSDVWSQIYIQEVEPNLGKNGRPTLIYEYPRDLAATTRFNTEKQIAERFEVYIAGVELGNCGNETPAKSESGYVVEKYNQDIIERKKSGRVQHPPDLEFPDIVLKLPQCSGIAIGLERLAMIFTDTNSIQELSLIHYEM